ncbi:hypothetical protein Tco_0529895 [Tanacetum coccineum]
MPSWHGIGRRYDTGDIGMPTALAGELSHQHESVGLAPSRIILFGTISAEIPTETPVISPVAPMVETTIVASPTGLRIGSRIIIAGGALVVIGGVGIGVVVCGRTCHVEETVVRGRRVVACATKGVSGIGVRTKGSKITETCTLSMYGDWICGISC